MNGADNGTLGVPNAKMEPDRRKSIYAQMRVFNKKKRLSEMLDMETISKMKAFAPTRVLNLQKGAAEDIKKDGKKPYYLVHKGVSKRVVPFSQILKMKRERRAAKLGKTIDEADKEYLNEEEEKVDIEKD